METLIRAALSNFSLEMLPPLWHEQVWPTIEPKTTGPRYLVGGAITRTIIRQVYGDELPITNYDLAVDSMHKDPSFREPWDLRSNMFRNWKVTAKSLGIHVDVWPFEKWIRFRDRPATDIDDALAFTPINVHAVAFEIGGGIHFHPAYVKALADRCVRPLCSKEFHCHCANADKTLEEELEYRAKRFKFTWKL